MGLKQDLEAELAEVQRKLNIINSTPEDTYSFGTIVIFSAATGVKWYYVKTGEENWSRLKGAEGVDRSLAEWIFKAVESNIGYFEVYVLTADETPIFAS